MSLPSVTIIGGTGFLGQHISNAFLTDFRSSFSRVRVLTRDPSAPKSQELASKGAELIKLGDTFDEAVAGADVIVNALGGGADSATLQAVIAAAAKSSAKVYFLSEFGADYRINDFPGYESKVWEAKQAIEKQTRTAFKGKVISYYTSLFTQLLATPALGLDAKNNAFTSYGPPTTKISFTSLPDVGRSVARLSILATDPATAASVPDYVRTASHTTSVEGLRDLVARVKSVPPAEITVEDLAAKKEALKAPDAHFFEYLKVVIGEGKADFSSQNDNELVNPGAKLWTWGTVEDLVRNL